MRTARCESSVAVLGSDLSDRARDGPECGGGPMRRTRAARRHGVRRTHGEPRLRRRVAIALACACTLAATACGGGSGGDSASAFCSKVNDISIKFAGLQSNPTPDLIQGAADAMQKLSESSPDEIKDAVTTEADAYSQWGASGDSSGLETPEFSAADDQVSAWESANCQQ